MTTPAPDLPAAEAVSQEVCASYQRHPYPPADSLELFWRLPPWRWMRSVAHPGRPASAPRRVLVAGCGTGREAYAIANAFPKAHIVAFDFSERAIEIARSHTAHFAGKCPEFLQADICDPQLRSALGIDAGQGFDFISCQGVASYVPDLPAALKQMAQCLTPKGLLYLGVNGAGHHSQRLRPLLAQIGVAPHSLDSVEAEEKARAVLRTYEILTRRREGELSDESTAYIANDLFGPMIRCLPLAGWLEACANAGLNFRGSLGSARFMAETFRLELVTPLLKLGRAEVAGFLDGLLPDVFHSLILTRSTASTNSDAPDFSDAEALMAWRPLVELWSREELAGVSPHDRILTMTLSIPGVHRRASFDCPFGIVELLRHADGKASLATLYQDLPRLKKLRLNDIAPYLFGLYHSNMLNFLQPL